MRDALFLIAVAVIFFAAVEAHSDEELVMPDGSRSTICEKQLEDEIYIVRMYEHGIRFTRMRQKAINSHGPGLGLDDEHFAKINKLIDEAENAAHEDKLMEWLNVYWKQCMEVI